MQLICTMYPLQKSFHDNECWGWSRKSKTVHFCMVCLWHANDLVFVFISWYNCCGEDTYRQLHERDNNIYKHQIILSFQLWDHDQSLPHWVNDYIWMQTYISWKFPLIICIQKSHWLLKELRISIYSSSISTIIRLQICLLIYQVVKG